MAGKNIGFSQIHGLLTGPDVYPLAGILFGKVFFDDPAVVGGLSVRIQDSSIGVDNLGWKADTGVKGFQDFTEPLFLYDLIQARFHGISTS